MESFTADEGVGLGKKLVLNADPSDVTLAQLAHEPAHVDEMPDLLLSRRDQALGGRGR
jgi:hypothetical protein